MVDLDPAILDLRGTYAADPSRKIVEFFVTAAPLRRLVLLKA